MKITTTGAAEVVDRTVCGSNISFRAKTDNTDVVNFIQTLLVHRNTLNPRARSVCRLVSVRYVQTCMILSRSS